MPNNELDETINEIQKELFNYCISWVDNKEIAEDLVQDTWVEFLEKYDASEITKENKPLLVKITKANLIDYLRRAELIEFTPFNENYTLPS